MDQPRETEGERADSTADREWKSLPTTLLLHLAFIILVLIAVVVVPFYHTERIAAIESDLADVVEPARRLGMRLALSQSTEMGALQAFSLSGEPRFRQQYRATRRTEAAVYDSLYAVAGELDLAVRETLIRMRNQALQWHLGHEPILTGDVGPDELAASLTDERADYDRLLSATDDLQRALDSELRTARANMVEARTRQIRMTLILVFLALVGTAATGYVGWRMVVLHREGQKRRRDAVVARRDMDAILDATGDGLMGLDMQGRCTFLNPAGEELLEIPSYRIMGREVHALIHHTRDDGEPCDRDECPILTVLETGEETGEIRDVLWRPDGSSFPVQLSVRPKIDGREVEGAVLTFTDLTEVQETQEALEKAVRAREEVVSVVSHDLRNPLSTVASGAELLLDLDDLPRERQEEHLRGIARAADRMDRLIRDLLDVARIEAGTFAVRPRSVSPESLVTEALEMSRALPAARGIELIPDVGPGLPDVEADPDRILQVFSNLVGNAVRFTPEGGFIRLGAGLQGEEVILEVEDSGSGIAPGDREYLFDRFWRDGRPERGGAGLGLAIVKGIVEAHGGRVWIQDGSDGGALFRFALRRDEAGAAGPTTHDGEPPEAAGTPGPGATRIVAESPPSPGGPGA